MGDTQTYQPVQVALLDVAQEDYAVPALRSGGQVSLLDVLREDRGGGDILLRFRFLAPHLGPDVDFDAVSQDMMGICEDYVMPRLGKYDAAAGRVVVSLSDRKIVFGETMPDVMQVFEAYIIENGACQLEFYD